MKTTLYITITTDDDSKVDQIERFVRLELERAARSNDALDDYDIEWAEVSDVAVYE